MLSPCACHSSIRPQPCAAEDRPRDIKASESGLARTLIAKAGQQATLLFRRLVLGCVNTDFGPQILIFSIFRAFQTVLTVFPYIHTLAEWHKMFS